MAMVQKALVVVGVLVMLHAGFSASHCKLRRCNAIETCALLQSSIDC